jgi:hypothetical protein
MIIQDNISKSYTVNVTNTWEKKTITFPGDTTGALDNDNANSFQIYNFWLGAGSDLDIRNFTILLGTQQQMLTEPLVKLI